MSKLTYTRCGDYYIPDLKLSEQPEAPIGKYGRMRQRYLKEHRPVLYSSLILSEKLYPHLLEIDLTAVSYTHLDVYKRQEQGLPSRKRPLIFGLTRKTPLSISAPTTPP